MAKQVILPELADRTGQAGAPAFLESPEKPFVKPRPALSAKLVFLYVVKEIKIKVTPKFRASRRMRLEDTKRIMSPKMCPKSFEKRASGLSYSKGCPDSTIHWINHHPLENSISFGNSSPLDSTIEPLNN